MKAEAIIIGNELLKGRTRDLNGHTLSKVLKKNNIELTALTIIADSTEKIHQSLDGALDKEVSFIFISGGLGPTKDDLTKQALAKYFNSPLEVNEIASKITEENYKNLGRKWNPELNFYHHFPKNFRPLPNPQGLAPGILIEHKGRYIFTLPGVPREFKAMLEQECIPFILSNFTNTRKSLEHFTIRTFGIPEEKIFNQLCPNLWDELSKWTVKDGISSLPNLMGIDIVLSLDEQRIPASQCKDEIISFVESSELAKHIWHYGDETVEELVVRALQIRNQTLSTSESCTGGYIGHLITNVSGCSDIYLGGVITYSNQQKVQQLDVSQQSLELHGAVSQQVALEMASGTKKNLYSDYSIAITGIAGPGGGTKDKPVGTAHVAIATPTDTIHYHLFFRGDRELLKQRFAQKAIFHLYQLLNLEKENL